MTDNKDFEATELDTGIFMESDESGDTSDIPTPYIFIDRELVEAEGLFIMKICDNPDLNEDNSLPFYISVQGKLERIGRFDITDLTNITRFRFLGIDAYLVVEPNSQPENLCITENMLKLVKINKER